jgi:DNA-binding SARP family transcriptional activator/TolB-like protein
MNEPTTRVLSFPDPSTARFHLRCWGEFSLYDHVLRQERAPRGRKTRGIIAYLACQGAASVSRERLAALLWSERGDQQARASLRQALLELKPYVAGSGAPLVVIERDHLELNRLAVATDAAGIEALARGDSIDAFAQAVGGLGDRLFEGLDGLDPAFDEWLALERRTQQDRLLALGAGAARRGLENGAALAVSRLATALQALEPTNETIAQLGMRADFACGDRSAVRRRRQRLCEALRQDLGAAPSEDTEALFAELTAPGARQAAAREPMRPAPASLPPPATEAPAAVAAEPRAERWLDRARRWSRARRWVAATLLLLLAASGGAGWLLSRTGKDEEAAAPRLAVSPFIALQPDPATKDLAAGLSDQLVGLLKENVVGLSLVDQPPSGAAERADLRLTGTVSRDGGNWRVRTSLEDPRQGVTLWAREFERSSEQQSVLPLEVGVATAEVVDDAIVGLQEKAPRRDARVLALALQSAEAAKDPNLMNPGEPRRLLEEAVARDPDFVGARASLALSLLFESARGAKGDRQSLAQRAREQADLAIRSDPAAAGAAYDTRYLMARVEAPDDLAAAENVLIEGSARATRFPFLYMRRCRFLAEVGLAREALPYCQRALALRPLASPLEQTYAEVLYADGTPDFATRVIENAVRFHPDHSETRRVQFELAAFNGRPEDAFRLLHRPDFEPCNCTPFPPEGTRALDLYLEARKSGTGQDAARAVAAMNAAVHHEQLHPRYLVFGAAALGRLDDAFAALEELAARPGLLPGLQGDPGLLFDGPATPLQRDPRFWSLVARAGYVKYWRTRGVWPDFCNDRSLPYDCRAKGASAATSPPQRASQ